jgi:dihydroxy-acid dehydratase
MQARRAAWKPPVSHDRRGYLALYKERITQAHKGCDFDFLEPADEPNAEPEIF